MESATTLPYMAADKAMITRLWGATLAMVLGMALALGVAREVVLAVALGAAPVVASVAASTRLPAVASVAEPVVASAVQPVVAVDIATWTRLRAVAPVVQQDVAVEPEVGVGWATSKRPWSLVSDMAPGLASGMEPDVAAAY